jgi:hypothetical protein
MTHELTHLRRRTLLAGAALGTALTFGAGAALAGAATAPAIGTPTAAQCARAAKVEARIEARLAKVNNTRLPKMEANEAKAVSSNHPKVAARIAKRVDAVKKLEARVQARLSKVEAKCGTGGTTAPAATTS